MATATSSAIEDSYRRHNQDFRDISLKIHQYAELSYHEYQSASLLAKFVEKQGFVVERGIAGDETAFVATFIQDDGPVISFNAVLA